jgi:hypothetical protein
MLVKWLITKVHELRYDCREIFCHALHFLFSENFDDDALGALTIEFTVEDTLPRTSIEATFCDGENYLGVHQQILQMSIAVNLSSMVMKVVWIFRR